MHNAKSLPLILLSFSLLAGGCVDSELMVPQSLEYDDGFTIVTELDPQDPGPISPDDDDACECGDLVAAHPEVVVFDDTSVTEGSDLDRFDGVVVVTGDLDVSIDEEVDFSRLADLRCIGGDLRIRAGSAFSLDDLPNLEYIGGAFIDDGAAR